MTGGAPGGQITTGMIMAAGFGTRMGALTQETPKPLIPLAGRPMIDHAVGRMKAAGVRRIVVNAHYKLNQMRAWAAERGRAGVWISEERELLETGGGVKQALPLLGEAPFFVLNADAIFTGAQPLTQLAAAWDPARMDGLLLLGRREALTGYTRPGDFTLSGDLPRRRGEAEHAPCVYLGAQILKHEAFDGAPEGAFSTNLVWDRLLEAGRLRGILYEGGWVDVGTADGLRLAEDALMLDRP